MPVYAQLVPVACLSAFVAGGLGCSLIGGSILDSKNRRALRRAAVPSDGRTGGFDGRSASGRVLSLALDRSRRPAAGLPRWLRPLFYAGSASFAGKARRAGLASGLTVEGMCSARMFLTVAALAAGCVSGALFSVQLAFLGGAVGAAAGWTSVPWALARRADERRKRLERHLSEAIEVICLGLRSGLSFDFALELYCRCFDGPLARELSLALQEWRAGLQSREQVLRSLAETYDSAIFSRVVENIVRALRFGSPLAESLEILAAEARQTHKAAVEERVMKAPVKMMLPVGTLILPSMLILVLGPVLIDLVQGF